MSCPPLFQPIRFLAACTLDRVCFSDIIFDVLPWGWSIAPFPRFSFMRIGERVEYLIKYLYVRAWGWVVDMKKGTLFTENPFKLLTI